MEGTSSVLPGLLFDIAPLPTPGAETGEYIVDCVQCISSIFVKRSLINRRVAWNYFQDRRHGAAVFAVTH